MVDNSSVTSTDNNIKQDISSILELLKDVKNGQESLLRCNGSLINTADMKELKALRAQVKGVEILLQQNAALEHEVERLGKELDDITQGVQKKGYLYKWRDREISFASKWCLRYFVLQGNTFSYYVDDKELRPRRTFDLSKCFVREEGIKKGFHVFSIFLGPYDSEVHDDGSLLIRLSTENGADYALWVDMVEQACAIKDMPIGSEAVTPRSQDGGNLLDNNESASPMLDRSVVKQAPFPPLLSIYAPTTEQGHDVTDDWGQSPVDVTLENIDGMHLLLDSDGDSLNPVMIKRVKSANLILRKSLSRQTMARRVLAGRAPRYFTQSGHRISEFADKPPAKAVLAHSGANKSSKLPRSFPAYKPMHVESGLSPLSSDTRPGQYSFRGFFNLGIIILLLSHLELMINNMSSHGLQVSFFLVQPHQQRPVCNAEMETCDYASQAYLQLMGPALGLLLTLLSWSASILAAFIVEKLASHRLLSNTMTLLLNFLLGTANLLLPCLWVWTSPSHPVLNMMYLFQSVIIWLKLISYSHANKDLRILHGRTRKMDLSSSSNSVPRSGLNSRDELTVEVQDDKPGVFNEKLQAIFSEVKDLQPPFVMYPQNLSLGNLLFFMVAPTLCYQLNYPRSQSVRGRYVVWIVMRMCFVAALMLFSVEQYIKPTLEMSLLPMQHMDVLSITERLLRLSIPNTYVWLWGFYLYFHLWLNFLAEITRFGDRQFYKDWWNARTIDRYWRTWNLPVHNWITRHLYYPLLRKGTPKGLAVLLCFAFSAVFHELIISLPFRHISLHAFFGMLAQVPLIFLTKLIDRRFDNSFAGNATFWCLFCVVGQPMGIIMYYFDIWKFNSKA